MADREPADFFAEKYGHGPDEATEAEMASEWNRLRTVQEARGFKPGWVAYNFKDLFGDWPPKEGYPDDGGDASPAPNQQSTRTQPAPKTQSKPAHDYGPPPMDAEPKHCKHCGGVL